MVAFDPDPSIRWLFCMTHPDDEISICAWIKRLTDAGAEVWISWTHASPVRQMEAQHAAEELGVPLTRLFFHGAEDGRVAHQMADLLPKFSAMMEKVQPARVACGAFEQGHLDHDATNCLVRASFDGPVFEIPFYYSYLTRMPRVNRFEDAAREEVIDLSPAEAAAKRYYAKLFPSQRIWRNMVWANMRSKLSGDGSLSKTERMRLQLPTDFTRVQHSGSLGKRIEESGQWQEWLKAYQSFRVSQL